MNIQAPPNLSPGVYPRLIAAGINDWGGVSPVTPDHVNPEAPWPAIAELARAHRRGGQAPGAASADLSRLTCATWRLGCAPEIATQVRRAERRRGLRARRRLGAGHEGRCRRARPRFCARRSIRRSSASSTRARGGARLDEPEIVRLFAARDADYRRVVAAADALRRAVSGDVVRYVVNRNINYTNICYYRCTFCAFSKGKTHEALRGAPYDLALEEIVRRADEAWERGATEVCLQGGIHPDYTGETYLDICRAIKAALPDMHIHAFSPLGGHAGRGDARPVARGRFWRGSRMRAWARCPAPRRRSSTTRCAPSSARTRSTPRNGSMSRATAHGLGLRTTSTIMYGHVERPRVLGAAPAGAARPAGGDRRLHRIRAAAVRAHGSADVSARARRAGDRPSARRC